MNLRWLREMFEDVRRSMGFRSSRWIYGRTACGAKARCHRLTGRVEFVLWPAGHWRGYPDREFWAPQCPPKMGFFSPDSPERMDNV